MTTYQDLLSIGDNEKERMNFIQQAIARHKSGDKQQIALKAQAYMRKENPTITKYQKVLYTMTGEAVIDIYSPNHKCISSFFNYFITQANQYLLGNGVTFLKDDTKGKLGEDFDYTLQQAGQYALVDGVCYGFFNLDRVEVFRVIDNDRGFVPLLDEETGALCAGIRYWQLEASRPLRSTLYELDGYTEYIKYKGEDMTVKEPKRPYKLNVLTSEIDGTQIIDGENYPTFPIVPFWANDLHQSEIVGLDTQIDAYDLIKSGFANDLDDASLIYWTLENCAGMDDVDVAKFIERMRVLKAANVDGDEGAKAQAHTIDVPYEGRAAALEILTRDLFRDAMALDVAQIRAGNTTATQIEAAYEPLNNRTDLYEYQVIKFINGILKVAGIEDKPSFKRSVIMNQTEETERILLAAEYLDVETIIKKLPFLSEDEVQTVIQRKADEELSRYGITEDEEINDEIIL